MSARDPLRTVWDALERGGFEPHGAAYKFRARCPVHDGVTNESLAVDEGADGRVLIWCFSGCDGESILDALDLQWPDLFPAGHRRARRLPVRLVQRADLKGPAQTIAHTLAALDTLGESWQAMVGMRCPNCGSDGAWLRAGTDADGFSYVDCPENCTTAAITQALAGHIADRRLAA